MTEMLLIWCMKSKGRVAQNGLWPDTYRRCSAIVKTLNIQFNSFSHGFICTAPAHNSSHLKACIR